MNQSPDDAWFYTREGERAGPVAFSELRQKAAEAALDPRLDMVWKQGMADWKPAGEIDGLFEKRTASEPQESLAPETGTYTPPSRGSVEEVMALEGEWPGARRRSFLFMTILFPVLWSFVFGFISPILVGQLGPEIMGIIGIGAGLLPAVTGIYFSLMRLVNLGMSRWWFLGNLIPILNFWIGYRCFACPPGYAYHKKMDGPGIVLAILYWLLLAVGLLAAAVFFGLMFGLIENPELQDQLREIIRLVKEQAAI